ncbi:MAG: hypothetical protein DRP57_09935 [Spirochaetes bacterium]|nr:MAG: hypothetical protein DRP57_09935 [Spirochaetota bacterium]
MKTFWRIGPLVLSTLFLSAILVISSCSNFSFSFFLSKELDGEYLGPLELAPSKAVMMIGKKITVSVSGGLEPYRYSCEKGTIDENGMYTAPSTSNADIIMVEDAYGDIAISSVRVVEDLQVLPDNDVVDSGGTAAFYVTGGLAPYTVSLTSDTSTVSFDNLKTISFKASSPSVNETDTVTVTDSLGNTAVVTVLVSAGGLYIDPPAATINIGDTISLTAYNGSPLYSFSIISGTNVGTLSTTSNPTTFTATAAGAATIQVTDSLPNTEQSTITVRSPDPLYLQPSSATVKIGDTIQFTASGGVAGYTYKVISGAGTIDSTTGFYTAVKQGNDRVQVTDSQGTTVTASISVKKN